VRWNLFPEVRVNESDFVGAARELEIPPAAVMAVNEVEAPSGGFEPDGRPRILFEGHVFHRNTGGRFDKIAPTLSFPRWTSQFDAMGARRAQRARA
jgi:hypothetical protein